MPRGVVHHDLKLDNMLLVKKGNISTDKIVDFGVARKLHPMEGLSHMSSMVGTPQYMAPEVVCSSKLMIVTSSNSTYGPACDLWSCGVILFMLLGGYPPFWHRSHLLLLRKIAQGAFDFNNSVCRPVTQDAKDLIRKLLVVDPAQRLTCEQVLAHPWMAGHTRGQLLPQTTERIRTSIINRLQKHRSERGSRLDEVIADEAAAQAAAEEERC